MNLTAKIRLIQRKNKQINPIKIIKMPIEAIKTSRNPKILKTQKEIKVKTVKPKKNPEEDHHPKSMKKANRNLLLGPLKNPNQARK